MLLDAKYFKLHVLVLSSILPTAVELQIPFKKFLHLHLSDSSVYCPEDLIKVSKLVVSLIHVALKNMTWVPERCLYETNFFTRSICFERV